MQQKKPAQESTENLYGLDADILKYLSLDNPTEEKKSVPTTTQINTGDGAQ